MFALDSLKGAWLIVMTLIIIFSPLGKFINFILLRNSRSYTLWYKSSVKIFKPTKMQPYFHRHRDEIEKKILKLWPKTVFVPRSYYGSRRFFLKYEYVLLSRLY